MHTIPDAEWSKVELVIESMIASSRDDLEGCKPEEARLYQGKIGALRELKALRNESVFIPKAII